MRYTIFKEQEKKIYTDGKFIFPVYDFGAKAVFRIETVRKYFISDVLGVPAEQIRSVRLLSPYLRRRREREKQGILDVLMEMNDNGKINMEIQTKPYKYWDKRNLFYLSKIYTDDLDVGQHYEKLKRTVCISLLGFNLTEREEYHSRYLLRDDQGNIFSDILELHIIELKKKLNGKEPVDDWIRFFNAKSEEEIDMIETKNPGIQEAIRELKRISLPRLVRSYYEDALKMRRDRWAREEYVRDEGISIGKEQGISLAKVEAVEQVMAEFHVPLEKACEVVQISIEKYREAKK